MFRLAEQSRLTQRRRRGSLLERRPRAPYLHRSNQAVHVYVAETLERHRDAFPNSPAAVGSAAAQGREHFRFAFGQQAAQTDHAAKSQELVRRIGRGLIGVVGKVTLKERLIALIRHDLCQFEIAAWAGQP